MCGAVQNMIQKGDQKREGRHLSFLPSVPLLLVMETIVMMMGEPEWGQWHLQLEEGFQFT